MALYKHGHYLRPSQDAAFDQEHRPGAMATHSGIYRCTNCGDEYVCVANHPLPSQNHRLHKPSTGPIQWMLVVYSQSP